MTRHRRIRRLLPERTQLDREAARAIERAVGETRTAIVMAALDAIRLENKSRYKHSPRLRRVRLRHVEQALEALGIIRPNDEPGFIPSIGNRPRRWNR